jgi:hypothetical protein
MRAAVFGSNRNSDSPELASEGLVGIASRPMALRFTTPMSHYPRCLPPPHARLSCGRDMSG